jgi:hypothetical protein
MHEDPEPVKLETTNHITGNHPACRAFPISVTAYTAPVLGYATNTP